MPKKTQFPRLRTHVRKGAAGQRWVSYWYDMRPEGKPDVSLGTDYDEALKQWRELHEHKPRIAGTLMEAFERWEKEVLPTYTNKGTARNYAAHLKALKPVFGRATWDSISFPTLVGYLEKRSAKTQGNREMALLSIIWHFARRKGLTAIQWPAKGEEKTGWKNQEHPRTFDVTTALFAAVYSVADQVLRDCMDISTATGMRITDARLCTVPSGAEALGLNLSASKTGKRAVFEIAASPILTALVSRRRAIKADHLFLLTTPTGKPVTAQMLRSRWDDARAKAAAKPENAAIADDLRAMYLRDMRKRASALAESDEAAKELLQHGSVATTKRHYPRATKLRPVR